MNGARKRGAALLSAFLTLALALVAVLTPTPALAADYEGGSLVVNGLVEGDKVTLYRVVKGDLADGTINYSFVGNFDINGDGATNDADWTAWTDLGETTLQGLDSKANAVAKVVLGNSTGYDKTYETNAAETDGSYSATFDGNLPAGEYLVVVTNSNTKDARVFQNTIARVVPGTSTDATTGVISYVWPTESPAITIKSENVSIDKKVNSKKQDDAVILADDGTKTVTYSYTTAIPNYDANATGRTFTITDVPESGIDITLSTVKVSVGTDDEFTASVDNKITIEKSGSNLVVNFLNDYVVANGGKSVTVTYDAVVTGQVHNDPKTNTVTVEYPKNSYTTDKGSRDDHTDLFSYEVKLTKTNAGESKKLAGAEFQLKDAKGNVIPVKFESGVYKVNEGGSTSVAITTDKDGVAHIDGLNPGTYTLTETKAPAGYQKLTSPITFTVTSAIPAGATSDTATVEQEPASLNNITNAEQPALPQTGGAGTIALTAVGVLLMAGAGAFVMRLRRDED